MENGNLQAKAGAFGEAVVAFLIAFPIRCGTCYSQGREKMIMPQSSGMSDLEEFNDISDDPVSPRAADWLWHPRCAKLFWTSSAVYWAGLYGLLLVPNDQQNYYLANAMILLVFVFNPITVLAVLGYGFLKAKVACGDWTAGSGIPNHQPKSLIDPYTDPFDVRSGDTHLRHIGVIQD